MVGKDLRMGLLPSTGLLTLAGEALLRDGRIIDPYLGLGGQRDAIRAVGVW